jgi:hypothetical protein
MWIDSSSSARYSRALKTWLLHATHLKAEKVQIQNLMVGINGFTVNSNGNAATAIDTLEEIHYHLKKFQLEITVSALCAERNLNRGATQALHPHE